MFAGPLVSLGVAFTNQVADLPTHLQEQPLRLDTGLLVQAASSQWGWAVFMLIWGLVVSATDNLMRPLLISSRAPVSTLAIFVGVIGGISAFGMIGVISGPVLLAAIAASLRFLDEPFSPARKRMTTRSQAFTSKSTIPLFRSMSAFRRMTVVTYLVAHLTGYSCVRSVAERFSQARDVFI